MTLVLTVAITLVLPALVERLSVVYTNYKLRQMLREVRELRNG